MVTKMSDILMNFVSRLITRPDERVVIASLSGRWHQRNVQLWNIHIISTYFTTLHEIYNSAFCLG